MTGINAPFPPIIKACHGLDRRALSLYQRFALRGGLLGAWGRVGPCDVDTLTLPLQHDGTRCGSFGIGRTWMFPVCVRPNAWRIDTRRFRQSADPLRQNSLFSAFFTQWVCSLAATPPQVSVSPPPNGGNGVIRGTTRRRHTVSQLLMLQNPHQHRRGGRWRAWLRYPWAVAGPGRASRCKTEAHIRDPAPLV